MRLAIIGLGKMGREIAAMAASRGHDVVWTLSRAENPGGAGLTPERLSAADVVFEFTAPDAAVANLLALGQAGVARRLRDDGLAARPSPRHRGVRARRRRARARDELLGRRASLPGDGARGGRALSAGGLRGLPRRGASCGKARRPFGNGADDRRDRRGGERRSPARHERARRDDSGSPPARLRVSGGRGRAHSPRPRTRRVRPGSRLGGRADRGPQGVSWSSASCWKEVS